MFMTVSSPFSVVKTTECGISIGQGRIGGENSQTLVALDGFVNDVSMVQHAHKNQYSAGELNTGPFNKIYNKTLISCKKEGF